MLKRKEYLKQWRRENHERNQQYVDIYKLSTGCQVCGYNKYAKVLDFHHTGEDKEFSIGHAITQCMKLEKIKEEIEKCIVLCRNCHAELHIKENIGLVTE